MELSPIADLDVERMFSKMRAGMLTRVTSGRGEAQGLPFYAALTIHCFTNEYVFSESEDEKQKIELLQEKVKSTLEKGKPVSPTRIAVLGAYRPLSSFSWADDLLRFKWPNDMKKVIIAQVNDVREEQALHPNIPCLTAIENKVSQAVRNQYEENPYPRTSIANLDVERILSKMRTFMLTRVSMPKGGSSRSPILWSIGQTLFYQ